MICILGLVWTQMRRHPGRNTERLRAVLIPDTRQLQMSASLHPHVGPKPRALSPCHRAASGGCDLSLFSGCGVGKHVAFLFIETQTRYKAFGAQWSRTAQRPQKPFCDQRACLGASILNLPLDHVFLCQRLLVSNPIPRLRNHQYRWPIVSIIVERVFGEIVKKCRQSIKIFLSDWIELVIVTVRASHCQPQEGSAVGFGAFALVVYPKLFGKRATLAAADAGPCIGRSHQRIQSLVRQHVSGKLLNDEPVEMLVLVVGADHVIAIGPDVAEVVDVKAMRIAVTSDVQPIMRAMFSISWAREQSINNLFICVRRIVAHKRLNLLGSWRQTSQVIRDAPNQRTFVCLRRRT